MNTAIVSIIILGIIILTKFLLSKEYVLRNIKAENLEEHIEAVLYRGFDASFAIFMKRGKKPFVQVYKSIKNKGHVELHLTIPLVEWSTKYLSGLKTKLSENSVDYTLTEQTQESPLSFLDCNFNTDASSCAIIIRKIFDEVFNVEPSVNYKIKFSRISPQNVKIGFQ